MASRLLTAPALPLLAGAPLATAAPGAAGLAPGDVDLKRGLLQVRRSEWEGHLTLPRGGRERQVVMTKRLAKALAANRHLRGDRVPWRDDGYAKVTQVLLARWMGRARRLAGLRVTGGIHSSATPSAPASPGWGPPRRPFRSSPGTRT